MGADRCVEVVLNRVDGYLRSLLLWKAELSCGDAAEGYALQTLRIGYCKAGTITFGQFLLLPFRWLSVAHNRADGVYHVIGRKIVAFGDFCLSGRFGVALFIHQPLAGQA